MRLNVSAWSIRRPVPSIILFLILTALGVMAFRGLPVERFPNIDFPLISVTVTQAGASPSELETQVSRRVEDAVSSVVGVKHMTSVLTDGASTTTIEFQLETNADRALNDVKDAITRIRMELPRTINEPIISRIDVTTMPIVTYAVSAPQMTLEELSWFIDDNVGREVQSVRGVAQIWRIGGVDREIRMSLDPQRLLALGVTAGDVNAQLRGTNADLSGGRSEIGGAEQTIRTLGGATTVERLASTSITLPGGRNVRLDELGKITDSYEEPRSFARLNGKPIVALSILRAKGASDLAVAERVEVKMQETARDKYPQAKFSKIDATVDYTAGNYHATMDTLVEGAVLAIIVVFLFLRDMRATVIAAIALPLSILPAFFAMQTLGFSLNLVTLLSLTLVTGILVDDAIVEVENIVRHMRMGKSAYRAALEAADEIGLAVIAITMTIIAVLCRSFMSGIAGQYFKQFGITVAAAVFFSLLVARLLHRCSPHISCGITASGTTATAG